jgi:hypothetical protein
MLHDFAYLESSSPRPTCPHIGCCSLSLYLGGCGSCEFSGSGIQGSGLVSLGRAELFQPAARTAGRGRGRNRHGAHRSR